MSTSDHWGSENFDGKHSKLKLKDSVRSMVVMWLVFGIGWSVIRILAVFGSLIDMFEF